MSGKLGSLGDVVFNTYFDGSKIKSRTFRNFQRTSTDRWAKNDIYMQKPSSQFIGPGLDTVTFDMTFSVSLGMNPRAEMDKLLAYSREGKVMPLIIGGKPLGVSKWKITGLTQTWEVVDKDGNLLKAGLNISLEEYV